MKKTIIISLGGSQIIPDGINYFYLDDFKKIILKNLKNYKMVIVCGGGKLAREYIQAVRKQGGGIYLQSLAGINATQANARFLSYFFGHDLRWGIPQKMRTVRRYLRKRGFVICGALEYKSNQTSDSTASFIAWKLKSEFVNLTDVFGLYTKNPKKHKDAKLIPKISWKDFDEKFEKLKFKPGQHFVLDQSASKIIRKKKIKTYILKNPKDLDNLLNSKSFRGTTIFG